MSDFIPKIIALDYETALTDDTPSVEYYRNDFRVISCAIAYRDEIGNIKTRCVFGEDEIKKVLQKIHTQKIPIIVHNLQFELGCTTCRFPEFANIPMYDTMRLSQLVDNGGKDFVLEFEKEFEDILAELEGKKPINGLKLEACVSRLGNRERYKHKEPFKKLMKERGGSDKSFDLLTREELAEYNCLDAEVTLDLYERTTKILQDRGIDWSMDHALYTTNCFLTVHSKIRGVCVDKAAVDRHITLKHEEYASIERKFKERFSAEINEIEQEMLEITLQKYKSEKGKETVYKNPPKFNINSTPQLKRLFVDKLGLTPKFLTKKGAPSFSSKLLWQWGDGGLLLSKRGKCQIELAQGEALKELSVYDGLWHIDIKVAGTKTSRMSGGSSG